MDDRQCKYVYKQCSNARAMKKDGTLHRLCDHHRNKANSLQKIYATKRRSERRAQRKLLMDAKKALLLNPIKADENTKDECPFLFSLLYEDDLLEPIEIGIDVDDLSDEEFAYLSEVL